MADPKISVLNWLRKQVEQLNTDLIQVMLRSVAHYLTGLEASLFFRLVSTRYEHGSMLITTNKGIRDWPELLPGDEVLATAILDRLLHHSYVFNIKGRSCRLRGSERAEATTQ